VAFLRSFYRVTQMSDAKRDELLYEVPGGFHLRVLLRNNNRYVVDLTNSIGVLVYVKDTKQVLVVREQRAALMDEFTPSGMIIGPVAGRFDKPIHAAALAVAEASEEAGATLVAEELLVLNSGRPLGKNSGADNERMTLTFVVIQSSALKPGEFFGAKDENEITQRLLIPVDEFLTMVHDDLALWGMTQFLSLWLLQQQLQVMMNQLEPVPIPSSET
jgi:hypothetical protein